MTCNGRLVTIGDKATARIDVLAVDGIVIECEASQRYYGLNKPAGVISTSRDTHGRKTVIDLVASEIEKGGRLFAVGRLDMESTGLILLTNDGFLANRILHPRFEVPRQYMIEVKPVPSRADIASLRNGVELEDGNSGQARVSLVDSRGGKALVSMVIHTGRKRQLRRSFGVLGYEVVSLVRVGIGSLKLGRLKPGGYRELTGEEVKALYRDTGLEV